MKVIVVGSDGYIGRPLCLALEAGGHSVERFDRGIYGQTLHSKTVRGSRATVIRRLKYGTKVDAVVDLAAYAHDPKGRLPEAVVMGNNAYEPASLSMEAGLYGASYITASSLSIYSKEGAYPRSKRALEKFLFAGPHTHVSILRFGTVFGVWGPFDPTEARTFRSHLFLNKWAHDMIWHARCHINGGQRRRPVLALAHAVAALRSAVEETGPRGTVTNHFDTCGTLEQFAFSLANLVPAGLNFLCSGNGADTRDYGWGQYDFGRIREELTVLIDWVKRTPNLPAAQGSLDALYGPVDKE